MPVTLGEIARRCGVSTATVSRILNSKPGFSASDELRQQVINTSEMLGYQPNRFARSLITGKSDIVAFAGGEGMGHQLCGSLLSGIRYALKDSSYSLLIEDYNRMLEFNPDGLIIWNEEDQLINDIKSIKKKNIKVVGFGDRYIDCDWLDSYVAIDFRNSVREGIEHLWANGKRNIACVHYEHCDHWVLRNDHRHLIYNQMAEELGFEKRCILIPYLDIRHCARHIFKEMATIGTLPDALFCFNDETAIGALTGLIDAGINVPEQVSVLGFDGIEDTEYTVVPISTIALPTEEGCKASVKLLTDIIENNTSNQRIVLQSELIKRQSSSLN